MNGTSRCAKCSRRLSPETTVPLWDGRSYCGECVEAACPGISELARTNARLEEPVAPDAQLTPSRVRWTSLLAAVALMAAAWIAALYAASQARYDWKGVLTVSGYVLVFFLPIIVGMWVSLDRGEGAPPKPQSATGTLSVENGRLTLLTRSDGWTRERCVPLTECEWYAGRAMDDPSVRARSEPDRNAVLIILYPHKDIWPDRQVIACGRTPEMLKVWLGFLALGGVPYRR